MYGESPQTATAKWWAEELKRMKNAPPPACPREWPLTEFDNNYAYLMADQKYRIRRIACFDFPDWLHNKHGFSYVKRGVKDKRPKDLLIQIVERRVKSKLPIVLTYSQQTRDPHMWDITNLFLKRPVQLTYYERIFQMREYIYDMHHQATLGSAERDEAKDLYAKVQVLFDDYQESKTDVQKEDLSNRLVSLEFQVRDLRSKVNKRFGAYGWNPELPRPPPREQPSAEDKAKLEYLKSLAESFMKNCEEEMDESTKPSEAGSKQREFGNLLEIYFK